MLNRRPSLIARVSGAARRLPVALAALAAFFFAFAASQVAYADEPAAAPDLATRVADLEAYVTNSAPKNLTTTSGPGHNAWMMTSSALVLFMTLPGLALFYGGLVQARNVLSVLMHCFAGIHRSGAFCAVFRMEYDGWSNERAIAELRACGYRDLDDEWDLLAYLETYRPRRLR